LGLENQIQTRRNDQVVDLLRVLVSTNFGLKGTTVGPPAQIIGPGATGRRGFNPYDSQLDFNPTNWLTFHNDNEYDFHEGHWDTENFDAEVHGEGWAFSLGNRYTRTESDQITDEFDYTINPKWKFKVYNTFPLTQATNTGNSSLADIYAIPTAANMIGNSTSSRENLFVLTRDLHEWEMDLSIDKQEGQGTTFFIMFRLKASPDMKFNLLQSSFQPSKPGAQN